MDIGGWLRSLELERYEQVFRDNEIDARVLPNLTGEDLKELGSVRLAIVAACSMPSRRCEPLPCQQTEMLQSPRSPAPVRMSACP